MRTGRPYPKDWERKFRVMSKLHERKLTITDLVRDLHAHQGHLSEVIWGVRRSPVMEERIAKYFGMTREELFPKPKRVARPESEAAA